MKRNLHAILTTTSVLLSQAVLAQTVDINAASRTTQRSTVPTFSVGSDRARIFLKDEHQTQLKALQSSAHFRYLRCHGIFNEEMKIVARASDGTIAYDWTRVDQFIDRLKDVKLRPFVECGFIPEALASGKQTIFWWRGNVTPPRDYNEWSSFIRAFARHEIDKRGLNEVRKWYFEVWNEPNLSGFWTGGQSGYFRLYESTARALKAEDSKLRVGGPSTAGMGWIPELLSYCAKNQLPIDFISSHSYAATEGFLDEKGRGGTTLVTTPGTLVDEFTRARQDIRKSAFPKLPLFITEWGPSYSPRDPIHDSYVCSPFILEKVRQCEKVVDGMSYWAFTDLFEEPGPPTGPLQGGFGLLNPDGLRKPAFYAYQFLGQLYPSEIPVGSPRIVVTKKGANLRVLVWDYSPPKADRANYTFYTQDLKPSNLPEATLAFSGLSPGHYSVSRLGTGYHRNDVFDAYLDLGKPESNHAHLSQSILDRLKSASAGIPEALPDLEVGKDGRAELHLPMRTNDVWFVDIQKKR